VRKGRRGEKGKEREREEKQGEGMRREMIEKCAYMHRLKAICYSINPNYINTL
jgi:hypothetical protein